MFGNPHAIANAPPLVHTMNRASAAEIAEHLRVCDDAFVPLLSERVDIDVYAGKIAAHAARFETWADTLVGLLAVYCNDPERQTAYVTSASVHPAWHRCGIAAELVERCVAHVRERAFGAVELEVDPANTRAVRLYASAGFRAIGACEARCMMRLRLGASR